MFPRLWRPRLLATFGPHGRHFLSGCLAKRVVPSHTVFPYTDFTMNKASSTRMEFGSSLAKAIYWVNLLVSDLEPPHIVKDCLWEYGCKHHKMKLEERILAQKEENLSYLSKGSFPPSSNISTLGCDHFQDAKTYNFDSVWQTEQPVMFGFADRRTSQTKADFSFNEDEYFLAKEIKQMVATLE